MTTDNRPLSPHLQVYRPQITSILSILHRITGVGLLVGLLLLTCWLVAAAGGAEDYAALQGFLGSWFGRLLLFGFTVALFYHLCNGIRHLYWDAGYGFELDAVNRSGWLVLIATAVLSVGSWALAYAMAGGL